MFIDIPSNPPITDDIACSKADDLAQWIQRSGSLPLTLYLNRGPFREQLDVTGPTAPIADVLTGYATRWEAVYLRGTIDIGWIHCPLLRLGDLNAWSSLRRLSLLEIHSIGSIETTIPWAQLTHLEIDVDYFLNRTVDALRESQELTWLSISICRPTLLVLSCPPLILPDLVTLHLTTESRRHLTTLMNHISSPSPREMFIPRFILYGGDDELALLGFLTRSACALDKLEIGELDFTGGSIVHVLAHQCCNSLTSLTISGRSRLFPANYFLIEDEFFERLSLYHDKPLCTRLRFLILEHYLLGWASSSALLGMVKSRIESRAGDGRLHFLSLKMKHFTHRDEQELEDIIRWSRMDYTLRRERKNPVTKFNVGLDSRSVDMYFSDSVQFE